MTFDIEAESLPLVDPAGSLILFAVLVALCCLAVRLIGGRTEAAPHLQRRWITTVKNLFLLLLLVGLALIWAPQLRTLALSLTAVAVAVVVAMKELILCSSGSFMRASSRAFAVGD